MPVRACSLPLARTRGLTAASPTAGTNGSARTLPSLPSWGWCLSRCRPCATASLCTCSCSWCDSPPPPGPRATHPPPPLRGIVHRARNSRSRTHNAHTHTPRARARMQSRARATHTSASPRPRVPQWANFASTLSAAWFWSNMFMLLCMMYVVVDSASTSPNARAAEVRPPREAPAIRGGGGGGVGAHARAQNIQPRRAPFPPPIVTDPERAVPHLGPHGLCFLLHLRATRAHQLHDQVLACHGLPGFHRGPRAHLPRAQPAEMHAHLGSSARLCTTSARAVLLPVTRGQAAVPGAAAGEPPSVCSLWSLAATLTEPRPWLALVHRRRSYPSACVCYTR